MQPVEMMQRAIDIGAMAERYMATGQLDEAAVLTSMADMYVSMARELRIGNHRMTSRGSTREFSTNAVYRDTVTRKAVIWDPEIPQPMPEPWGGPPVVVPEEPGEAAPTPEEGSSADPLSPVIDGGETHDADPPLSEPVTPTFHDEPPYGGQV